MCCLVLDLNAELISVKNIQKVGYSDIFKNDVAIVEKCKKRFAMAKLSDKRYYVTEFTPIKFAAHVIEHDADTDLLQRRLGHLSNKKI